MLRFTVNMRHAVIGFDASKILLLIFKIKNALAHRKTLKTKSWRHYLMKTHVRRWLTSQTHLKALGMIQETRALGAEVERRRTTSRVKCCFNSREEKVFLHRTVTGDEKWIQYNKPKGKRSRGKTATHWHLAQSQISMIWSFSSVFEGYHLGAIYYEFLKPNETITEYLYQLHLMRFFWADL